MTLRRPALLKRIVFAGAGVVLSSVAGLMALDAAFPARLERLTPSTRVFDRDGALLHAFLTASDSGVASDPPAWRLATRPAEGEPRYLAMLFAVEDKRYFSHPGVDPLAAGRAAAQMIGRGRVVSGASTLTMQAARLLEPRTERTWRAKIRESLRALQLTARLGKEGTLSAYLTLAPFGGNLEGVRAGSLAWFGKEPGALTPGEAALLVAIPRSPETLRPDRHPDRARKARDFVIDRALDEGVLSPDQAREARSEPIPAARRPLPKRAPHLARRLAAAASPGSDIRTTIDGGLQARLEALARDRALTLAEKQSLAILAVESGSGRVLAAVGAPNEVDAARSGYVDMTRAVRSPGSALKPLIYGMAFERRALHPKTVMTDKPTRFGAYTPANFDDAHWGEVTAEDALIHSLNVPAVMALDRVGPMELAGRLSGFGVPLRLPAGTRRPGLPLALGGLGVTLEELVAIYAAIDAGGRAPYPSAMETPADARELRDLLDQGAAWMVADVLSRSPPPEGYAARRAAPGGSLIAFKTGTSYGYRDAFAIGFNARTTIGVWVGRPDGSSSPGDFGRRAAAPILFQAFERLEPQAPRARGRPPDAFAALSRTNDLPRSLRRFAPEPGGAQARLAAMPNVSAVMRPPGSPSVAFPPDGAVLDWRDYQAAPLTLSARGGQRPFVWLVNGRPVASAPHARATTWTPDGPGALDVTLIDAKGRAARVRVWLRAETDGAPGPRL